MGANVGLKCGEACKGNTDGVGEAVGVGVEIEVKIEDGVYVATGVAIGELTLISEASNEPKTWPSTHETETKTKSTIRLFLYVYFTIHQPSKLLLKSEKY